MALAYWVRPIALAHCPRAHPPDLYQFQLLLHRLLQAGLAALCLRTLTGFHYT